MSQDDFFKSFELDDIEDTSYEDWDIPTKELTIVDAMTHWAGQMRQVRCTFK